MTTTTSEGTAANEIRLSGYLSAPPDIKELESGATIVLLRVVVRRPNGDRVDSLPVAVGPSARRGERRAVGQATARTVKRAAGLDRGDEVVVSGWLQRRFWDAGGQRRSRLQVVAETIARA